MMRRHVQLKRLFEKTLVTLTSVGLLAFSANQVGAEQFESVHHGRAVVVHTSQIPVLLHRLIPPNHGRHITLREYQTSRRSSSQSFVQNADAMRKTEGNLTLPRK